MQVIEDIAPLTNLTTLYLGKNKITKIANLETLTNLTVLDLQVSSVNILYALCSCVVYYFVIDVIVVSEQPYSSNRRTGYSRQTRAVILESQRHQQSRGPRQIGIEAVRLVSFCKSRFILLQTKLTTLDLAGNRLTRLENISHLVLLEELWVI